MSEKRILKKLDDIFNYCEEIDNHLPKEEQTGYEMLPDIFYIQKEVHKLQQKVEQLENIRKEAIECIETDSIEINTKEYGNLTVINSDDLLNILNKGG